jgi:3-methyladenine DNA glycosylase Tag
VGFIQQFIWQCSTLYVLFKQVILNLQTRLQAAHIANATKPRSQVLLLCLHPHLAVACKMPESQAHSAALKEANMSFVGPTMCTLYS